MNHSLTSGTRQQGRAAIKASKLHYMSTVLDYCDCLDGYGLASNPGGLKFPSPGHAHIVNICDVRFSEPGQAKKVKHTHKNMTLQKTISYTKKHIPRKKNLSQHNYALKKKKTPKKELSHFGGNHLP